MTFLRATCLVLLVALTLPSPVLAQKKTKKRKKTEVVIIQEEREPVLVPVPGDAQPSEGSVPLVDPVTSLDEIPLPPRAYSIKTSEDFELCRKKLERELEEKKRVTVVKFFDPERKESDAQKAYDSLLDSKCGFRSETYTAEDNLPTFSELHAPPPQLVVVNSPIDAYGAAIGAAALKEGRGAANFRGSFHVNKNLTGYQKLLLDTDTGITVEAEMVIDPTDQESRLPYARATVKATDVLDDSATGNAFVADGTRKRQKKNARSKKVHEYTIERNADLDRWNAHVAWGRRGVYHISKPDAAKGTLGWYLPWVLKAKTGVQGVEGNFGGFFGIEGGLEERRCHEFNDENRVCLSSAMLATLGYLQAGLEIKLGGDYEYTVETEKNDRGERVKETVVTAGIENTYHHITDQQGDHDGNHFFLGVGVEHRRD